MVAKVLKLDERVLAVPPYHSLHELVDEVIVLLAGDSLVTVTDVEVILQQFLGREKKYIS